MLTRSSCSGAVKTNIGHLGGASGIAGVMKAVFVPEKGIIPTNANFQSKNPKMDTDYLHIEVTALNSSALSHEI